MTHEKGIEGRERGRGQSGDRIEGASRFAAFCKIQHGMATYKSDFEGRLLFIKPESLFNEITDCLSGR